MMRPTLRLALAALLFTTPALAREPLRPAELPPPDYRGQQYVDSQGCLFMRTGAAGNETWLPRVNRQGVPLCGYPPSGQRVPVAEEGTAPPPDPTAAAPAPAAAPESATAAATSGYYVAVGSFGVAGNAERAAARLAALNYGVAQSRPQGAGGLVTVLAGPYPSEAAATGARGELRKLGFPDAIVIQVP